MNNYLRATLEMIGGAIGIIGCVAGIVYLSTLWKPSIFIFGGLFLIAWVGWGIVLRADQLETKSRLEDN